MKSSQFSTEQIIFLEDHCQNGTVLRILTVMDEFTREGLAIEGATSIPAQRLIRVVERLVAVYGAPAYIRSDNYDEVVVDRVFAGATQLVRALPALMLAAEQTLDLDFAKRALMAVGPRRSSDDQGLFQYACGTLGRERGALGRRPAYRGPPNRLRDDRGNRV